MQSFQDTGPGTMTPNTSPLYAVTTTQDSWMLITQPTQSNDPNTGIWLQSRVPHNNGKEQAHLHYACAPLQSETKNTWYGQCADVGRLLGPVDDQHGAACAAVPVQASQCFEIVS